MSIPLDRLYHYIESLAEKAHGDHAIIYLFKPHGSKKIEDLEKLHNNNNYGWAELCILPQIYCHDQEPLNFDLYKDTEIDDRNENHQYTIKILKEQKVCLPKKNLRSKFTAGYLSTIYDKVLLLHSELRSEDVKKYQDHDYIPVYYWNHAVLARDWFRYAKFQKAIKNATTKQFLIYNRAWAGTREYRLKFLDHLVQNNLIDHCCTWFNPVDPETKVHYSDHEYKNLRWQPVNRLEDCFSGTSVSSNKSADFELNDYANTDFEIVLETLFDDQRLHLTEKTLRPIACGQPFLLMTTHGSLQYLRNYGFKTFDGIIDESYDLIPDPEQRMQAVIQCMKQIASWDDHTREKNMTLLSAITQHNQEHFFSNEFFNLILGELDNNLNAALKELEDTNTSAPWIDRRKQWSKNPVLKKFITDVFPYRDRQDLARVLKHARKYYQRTQSTAK